MGIADSSYGITIAKNLYDSSNRRAPAKLPESSLIEEKEQEVNVDEKAIENTFDDEAIRFKNHR